MGEAADDMLEGRACSECGEWFHDDEDAGFPRKCAGCLEGHLEGYFEEDKSDDFVVDMIAAIEHLKEMRETAKRDPRAKKVRVDLEHLSRVVDFIYANFDIEGSAP